MIFYGDERMKNKSALYALSYIQECDNPYVVFCNLIQYVLYKTSKNELPEGELVNAIKNEFGITIPRGVVKIATGILLSQKIIEKSYVYRLVNCTIDIKAFEDQMDTLKSNEQMLLLSIKKYLYDKYNQDWDDDRIIRALSSLLTVSDYNASVALFSKNDIEVEPVLYSDEYFVKRYLQWIIETKDICFHHVLQIVKGIIIFIGISQADDLDAKKKNTGTKFFIDTKLALRILGYSNQANVQASKELVRLIQDTYGGKICIFGRTIEEVHNALSKASEDVKAGCFTDLEMYQFCLVNNYNSMDFSIDAENINLILTQNGITIEEDVNWNVELVRKHTLDIESLIKYISKMHPKWKESSIKNDVYNINQINILRKSNYSKRYGGDNKLPILVTTNGALVETIKSFVRESEIEGEKCLLTSKSVPIITDDGLMCGLWTKFKLSDDLPLIRLSQIAYSAQQTDSLLFDKINETAKRLDKNHYGHILNLDERRREKLYDLIYKNSSEGEEEISESIVAESFDELVQLEMQGKNLQIEQLQGDLQEQKSINQREHSNAVKIAVSKYQENYGASIRLSIFMLKFWWVVIDVLIAIGTVLVNLFVQDITKNSYFLSIVIPIIVAVVPIIINYVKGGDFWRKITVKINKRIVDKYKRRILKLMTPEERIYQNEIVTECLKNFTI